MNGHSSAWQRGILRWRYLVVMLLLLFLAFFLVMRGVNSDKADVEAAYAQSYRELLLTQEAYNALSAELDQVGSSSYIENVARQNFSFLWEGELRFEITNPENLNGYTYEEMQILQEERKLK
ncbi:MAG: hypothetical protein J1E43_05850 [Christensenellaceae bacterium]|nr:hypothetical protein [Christensenellaceae bacterium]